MLDAITGNGRIEVPQRFSWAVKTSSNAVTTKWTCKRHNGMLSPWDREARRYFDISYNNHLHVGYPGAPADLVYNCDIAALERWLLKTMCAFYSAGWGGVGRKTHRLPRSVSSLFFRKRWPRGWGLYVYLAGPTGERALHVDNRIGVRLMTSGDLVCGIQMHTPTSHVALVVSSRARLHEHLSGFAVFRPAAIVYRMPGRGSVTVNLMGSESARVNAGRKLHRSGG